MIRSCCLVVNPAAAAPWRIRALPGALQVVS
jgi:hypothetical protein